MGIKGQIERLGGEERGRIGLRCFAPILGRLGPCTRCI